MSVRSWARALGVVASTCAGALAVAVGCGDDASGTPATDGDAGTGSSSGSSSGASSGGASSSGASSSGTTSSGGASSGGASSSGLVPAPDDPQYGRIACGTASCDVEAGANCCLRPEGATCTSAGDRCDGGIRHICDEGKDCDNVEPTSCCLGVYGTGTVARCSASGCVGSNPQLCRSTAECDGDICAYATCAIGSGTVTIRTCGGKC